MSMWYSSLQQRIASSDAVARAEPLHVAMLEAEVVERLAV
jgi:hypothetical protein